MTALTPEIEEVVAAAAAAARPYGRTAPRDRAAALVAVADALEVRADDIVALGIEETGLAEGRMRGELKRTANQLRLFAEVVVEGAYLDARIDEADPDFVIGPRPDVRRVLVPVGPVINFAASNFPLAFSVAGGDTAAALAAGCPVIVKTHPGHPKLSELTGSIVAEALAGAGMPAGAFATISGDEAGVAVLTDERIRAGAFTGSNRVGQLLAGKAAARATAIPFFGELGSVNPVVVTEEALAERADDIATGFVTSVSGSAGQLCTKPGFLFVPDVEPLRAAISEAADGVAEHRELNPGIARGYDRRRHAVLAADGVEVLAEGGQRLDDDDQGWVTPTVVSISLADLEAAGEAVLEETFGPFSVVVHYDSLAQVADVLERHFPGNLTTTLHAAEGETSPDLDDLVATLTQVSGRVLFGGWPTGVAVTPAMQHGGPSPSTTSDNTSVGTAAITRFLRGVAYQSAPQETLHPALRDDNPWGVPQRRSEAGLSADWGQLTGRY
ncbi:MAG: aldehyde dehydrogenase (NADP(+)) [Propionibacteriaceae bacterium]